MKLSDIRQEGNGVEWGAPVVPDGVEKSVVVGGHAELDAPVVIFGAVAANGVVVVLAPGAADWSEAVDAKTLAVVVVGVPVFVIAEDMLVCFCIYVLKFNSGYFNKHELM